jgi:protein-S-isoprenylcysteine O-methyltransferase Ste14
MHAAAKVLIGLILIAIGLGLFVDSLGPKVTVIDWLQNFIVVLTGFIPPFLILIGLFVVWLEIDEIKAERELKAEEEKDKDKENPKPKPRGRPGRPKKK